MVETKSFLGLRMAISEDESLLRQSIQMSGSFDPVTIVERGSFLGRKLEDYISIICGDGAPNFMSYARSLGGEGVIVDTGCGACVALAGMRDEDVTARLVGIDVRDVAANSIRDDGRLIRVDRVLQSKRIEFVQNSLRNIPRILPLGYDLLLNVFAFYEAGNTEELQLPMLRRFYKGLRRDGRAYVVTRFTERTLEQAQTYCTDRHIPMKFYPHRKNLGQDSRSDATIEGTVYLGPKP